MLLSNEYCPGPGNLSPLFVNKFLSDLEKVDLSNLFS